MKAHRERGVQWAQGAAGDQDPCECRGDWNFYGEYGDGNALTSVTFADGSVFKRICHHAFTESMSLEEIEIPASVEELCEGCFSYCFALSRVLLRAGVW